MNPPDRTSFPTIGKSGVHRLALAALILSNILLAFGPMFVRAADVGPVAAGFWRLALAAPILIAAAPRGGWRPVGLSREVWGALALGGLCFAADLAAWHLGILRTQLANATLFGNSAVLFFPIYGFFAARVWPSVSQGIALCLALAGAVLLLGQSAEFDGRHLLGDLLCLLAGIFYTVYFVTMARARRALAPAPALALATLAGLLPLLAAAVAMGERVWPQDWTPLIALALASQVLGQGLMTFALGQLSPMVIGVALLTQPVVAGIIGWTRYGERLGPVDLIGAGAVAIALVLVRRERRVPLAAGHGTGA